jgi:tellurite resistance protein TehA-like permease
MTLRPLAALSTVLLMIGAHGLSALHVFLMASSHKHKQEHARSSFSLVVVAQIAQPNSHNLAIAHQTLATGTAKFQTSVLGALALLLVVMVTRLETAPSPSLNLDKVWIVLLL